VTLAHGESPERVWGANIQRQVAYEKIAPFNLQNDTPEMSFSGVLMYDKFLYHTLHLPNFEGSHRNIIVFSSTTTPRECSGR
jgi:hypothetical protein